MTNFGLESLEKSLIFWKSGNKFPFLRSKNDLNDDLKIIISIMILDHIFGTR